MMVVVVGFGRTWRVVSLDVLRSMRVKEKGRETIKSEIISNKSCIARIKVKTQDERADDSGDFGPRETESCELTVYICTE